MMTTRAKIYEFAPHKVAFTPRVFVMINSRNPMSLKRDDVVDRLLIFSVDQYQKFIPDAQLLNQVSNNRGQSGESYLTTSTASLPVSTRTRIELGIFK